MLACAGSEKSGCRVRSSRERFLMYCVFCSLEKKFVFCPKLNFREIEGSGGVSRKKAGRKCNTTMKMGNFYGRHPESCLPTNRYLIKTTIHVYHFDHVEYDVKDETEGDGYKGQGSEWENGLVLDYEPQFAREEETIGNHDQYDQ